MADNIFNLNMFETSISTANEALRESKHFTNYADYEAMLRTPELRSLKQLSEVCKYI